MEKCQCQCLEVREAAWEGSCDERLCWQAQSWSLDDACREGIAGRQKCHGEREGKQGQAHGMSTRPEDWGIVNQYG
jgi:hypothetical protein